MINSLLREGIALTIAHQSDQGRKRIFNVISLSLCRRAYGEVQTVQQRLLFNPRENYCCAVGFWAGLFSASCQLESGSYSCIVLAKLGVLGPRSF